MADWSKRLRDYFLFAFGAVILHHEIWVEEEIRPLGVLIAGLLLGLIPAFHADESLSTGPLGLFLRAVGLKVEKVTPEQQEAAREELEAQAVRADLAAGKEGQEGKAGPAGPDSTGEEPRSRPPSEPQA